MKCQILFSGKIRKNISILYLLKILPRLLSVNVNSVDLRSSDLDLQCLHKA